MNKTKADKWQSIKSALVTFLKGEFIKLVMTKVLKMSITGGFRVWLVKFILTELFEEVGEPLLKAGFNLAGYAYDKVDGKIIITKVDKARLDNDKEAYRGAVNDIFSK